MNTFNLLRLAIPLAIILIAFMGVAMSASHRRSVLKSKFPKQFAGATALPAICANETDLAGRPRQLLQSPKGFVLIHDKLVTFVGGRYSADESMEFDRANGWQVSFIPASAMAIGLPDLVRVANADSAYFLIGTGALDQPSKSATQKIYEALQRKLERQGDVKAPAGSNSPFLFVMAALMICAVGVIIYAALEGSKPLGPQILARGPQDSVLAGTEDALLRFNADGSAMTVIPLAPLGIDSGVAGMRVLADGSVLIGDFGHGTIVRCNAAVDRCEPLKAFADPAFRVRGALSFEPDASGDAIFLADTGRHRLLKVALDGGILEEYRGDGRKLCFPNTIRVLGDGRLLVADTNNFRILEWPAAATWPEPPPMEHLLVEHVPAEYGCNPNDRAGQGNAHLDRARDYHILGRPKPFSGLGRNSAWVAQFDHGADGRWWVLFNGDNVRHGDAGIVDANWALQRVLPLPDDADPWDILAFGDGALVADPVAAKIYRFDHAGRPISDFGAAALDDYLAPAKAKRKQMEMVKLAGPITLVVIALALVPLALLFRKRRVREILALPNP